MENNNHKEKRAGVLGTLILHLLLFLILWFCFIRSEVSREESGVPVMLGTEALAQGGNYRMTEVDVRPMPATQPETPPTPEPSPSAEELISQKEEETVAVEKEKETAPKKEEKKPEPKKETPKQPAPTPEPQEKPREKTEAELRAEAEQAAAEAVNKSIAGAFGKGSAMNSRGEAESGKGAQGSPTGNSDTGKTTGTGGYGTFDLGGRSLGEGGLPVPVYNVQDEGRVVVTITVNPAGEVIATSINKRTNTVNATLRRAAEEAARKARFNAVSGVNNQSGTITYYFKLK